MARGLALLVGLKQVDPAAYQGWDGQNGCWGCELDVDNVARVLSPLDYEVNTLKTAEATADSVLRSLGEAAEAAAAGDVFVFYYSGHGGQQPDISGDELDGQDETLVAYDRQIVDDELNAVWLKFRPKVRIVMLSDSCNSGTNYRMKGAFEKPTPFLPVQKADVAQAIKAQMIHMGGCRDGFGSSGYLTGGAFTMALCEAWAGGEFQGDYPEFHKAIVRGVRTGQRPQYSEYGPVTDEFRRQRPFTIGAKQDTARVECMLTIDGVGLDRARAVLVSEAGPCLLDAFASALAQRPSFSGSCTADSSGNWSCTGTVTVHF